MGIENAIRFNNAILQRCHQHQRLDGRPRFKGVADGAIAEVVERGAVPIVRVKVRETGHGEYLSGLNID
ncbi:hypothetical protein D1872_300500 [compost metagenome]